MERVKEREEHIQEEEIEPQWFFKNVDCRHVKD